MGTVMSGKGLAYIHSVKSYEECGMKCLDTPNCVVWKWNTPSFWNLVRRKDCSLYSSHTNTFTAKNHISGLRGCTEPGEFHCYI